MPHQAAHGIKGGIQHCLGHPVVSGCQGKEEGDGAIRGGWVGAMWGMTHMHAVVMISCMRAQWCWGACSRPGFEPDDSQHTLVQTNTP